MKRILFLASLLLMSMGIFAQEVTTLTFTAKQQNNAYQQLDSVVVTNLTKDWTEVIYYPDTLLLMNTVGITDWENSKGSVKLYQNIPNPFHGITDFNLTLSNKEKVELVIFDINGKKVAEYHNTLPSGEHMFRATMNTPQTYLLSAVTKNGNTSIKMINLSNTGAQAHIEYVSSKPLDMDMTKKQSQNPFSKGDNMKYVGYATQNDGSHNAEVTQTQQGSETITFTFPTETQDPIVQAFTDDATTITLTSATLNGHYNVVYAEVEELGFAYKVAGDTAAFEQVYVTTKNSPFSHNLVGLENGTEYVFKAFVKADSTLVYGEEKTFTTEKVKETKVITGDATDINKRGATLHGSYELGNEELMMVGFEYKVKGTEDWKQVMSSEKVTPFEVKIDNQLEPETEYVYRAIGLKSGDYAQINGEEKSFKTAEKTPELPKVVTVKSETDSYNNMGAKLFGTLAFDGDCEMKEVGFCLGKDANPKDNGVKQMVDLGTDKNFSFETGILEPATTYYYIAYATNAKGTAYGEVMTFTTREAKEKAKLVVNNITAFNTSATVESEVVAEGGETITERGICFSTKGEPTITDTKVVDVKTGKGTFTLNMDNLTEGTEYKVRAYAISWAGTAYSETKTFTTIKMIAPEMTTDSVFKIGGNSATVASTLTVQGGSPNIVVGAVVSKENNEPTIDNDLFYEGILNGDVFMTKLSKLEKSTKYYVRAYAKNEVGAAYGKVLEFTTADKFICGDDLEDIEKISYATVQIGSQCWMQENLRVTTYPDNTPMTKGFVKYTDTIYGLGDNVYYEWSAATRLSGMNTNYEAIVQGVCPTGWHIPSYSDFHKLFNTIDPEMDLTNVKVNNVGKQQVDSRNHLCIKLCKAHPNWSLSNGTTPDDTPAWATANDPSDFNASGFSALPFGYSNKLSATDIKIGPDNQCGLLTSNAPNASTSSGRTLGIKPSLTGIIHEQTNDHGWSVRCVKDPDPVLPEVITNEVGVITSTTAAVSGKLEFNGYADITEKGFYYGETQNVKEEGTKVVVESATDAFETTLTDLKSKTIYYVAAFATNVKGDGLGEVKSFETLDNAIPATVKINGTEELKAISVKVNCEVVEDGGEPVTERGLCWNTATDPTVENSTKKAAEAGVGEYTIAVDGLTQNTPYYFRAYAITIKGTAYSDNFTVTTPEAKVPEVKTDSVNNITNNGVLVYATIINKGNLDITECGVLVDTVANSTNATKVSAEAIADNYSVTVSGLEMATKYYVRAFATNASGTSYGEELSFTTTSSFSCGGYIKDEDGHSYKTVKIGTQCWMAENLKTTKYADGTDINPGSNTSSTVAYRYSIENNSSNDDIYGLLYNWPAVADAKGICPKGWHAPSNDDWTLMTDYVGAQSEYACSGNTKSIAKALASTTGWSDYSGACCVGNTPSSNNGTGFNALPAGAYNKNYYDMGDVAYFWTATQSTSRNAYFRALYSFDILVDAAACSKYYAYSVRCVMDELVPDEPEEDGCTAHITIDGDGWSNNTKVYLLVDDEEITLCNGEATFEQDVTGKEFVISVSQSFQVIKTRPLDTDTHFRIEFSKSGVVIDSNDYLEKLNEATRWSPVVTIKCGDTVPVIE